MHHGSFSLKEGNCKLGHQESCRKAAYIASLVNMGKNNIFIRGMEVNEKANQSFLNVT